MSDPEMNTLPRSMKVLLVCSPGGHLQQMLALEPAWRGMDRAWVTLPGADVGYLLAEEEVTLGNGPTNRSVRHLISNISLAWRPAPPRPSRRDPLDRSGPRGPLLPRRQAARDQAGLRRERHPDRDHLAQRPARLPSRRPLLRAVATGRRTAPSSRLRGERAVIFVTVGTHHQPFERLLDALAGLDGELVVQYGPGQPPAASHAEPFMPFDEMLEPFPRSRHRHHPCRGRQHHLRQPRGTRTACGAQAPRARRARRRSPGRADPRARRAGQRRRSLGRGHADRDRRRRVSAATGVDGGRTGPLPERTGRPAQPVSSA